MRRPLGFMSPVGAVLGIGVVAAVIATTLALGPVLFSPGELSARGRGRDLGGVSDHAQLGNRCEGCHSAPWSGVTMADRCVACHTDVAEELKTRTGLHGKLVFASPTCTGCHTDHNGPNAPTTVVDPATFRHDLTGYSLRSHRRTAKGSAVTCTDCHPKRLADFDVATCAACHAKLDPAFMAKHRAAFGPDCLACHRGFDLSGSDFDHGMTRFKLTGKHSGVACTKCHSSTGSLQALRSTPTDCYGCHAKDDHHKGTFGRQCDQCHTTNAWDDVHFDHSVFPMDHGREERKATCATCHPNGTGSYTCFGCHEHTPANVLGEHEGRSADQLRDCIKCHQGGRSEGGG